MNAPLHLSDDRLIDLVNHLLSSEEERLALAHFESCAECEERFRLVLRDHETARSIGGTSRSRRAGTVVILPRGKRLIPIATVAAAVVVLGYLVWDRSTTDRYWVPFEFDESALRSADSVAAGASDAFRAYAEHDAARTVELLRNTPPPDDEMLSSLRRLMLASALLNGARATESLDELEKLQIFSLPVKWREQAQWVEYLALRDAGRGTESRERLELLSQRESDIGARAREELKRLGPD